MACAQAPCSPVHPRISFSQEFTDGDEIPSIDLLRGRDAHNSMTNDDDDKDFEFIVMDTGGTTLTSKYKMLSADELFFQGRMLCLNQIHNMAVEEEKEREDSKPLDLIDPRYVDDDPSPRPPRCTVGRWRELLRLKRQPTRSSCKPTYVSDPLPTNEKDPSTAASRKEEPTSTQTSSRKKLQVKAKESRTNTSLQRSSSNPERLSSLLLSSNHPEKLSTILLRKREKQEEQCPRSCCRGSSVDRSRSLSIRVSPVLNVVPMCSPGASHLFPPKKQMPRPARFHSTVIRGSNIVLSDADQKR